VKKKTFWPLLLTGASRSLFHLAALAWVSDYPGRVKCATLPWHALRSGIEGS
jgi:NifU-like protein involved in Fe-S cluster formation